ncbi:Deoxyribodipyrimidine photolyase/cryptochrome [Phaffia rhodozyma]|uniref:Cryptochrome DASH n=1 Tax=Phaffia rhodozyma TaxID=264483 RepID=A0A0F7SRG4_PHARH|nr:Deoxyribodipyrimidine photolyase/cryptochrome [Phaffia rhodozyma]
MSPTTKPNVLVLLFRNDLRIHDNPILNHFPKSITHVLPVYIFDERVISLSALPGFKPDQDEKLEEPKSRVLGTWRCGGNRVKFLAESVFDLKSNLRKINSDLMIGYGLPEKAIPEVVRQLQNDGMDVSGVWVAQEVNSEEMRQETRIQKALGKLSPPVPINILEGSKTLIHPADLPFKPSKTPDNFTAFRGKVEGLDEMIRPNLPTPTSLPPPPPRPKSLDVYQAPQGKSSLEHILPLLLKPITDSSLDSFHSFTAHPYHGGESSGLERMKYYCGRDHQKAPLATYKQTRNGLIGSDFSTKFSSWLGLGCLSPRMIGNEIKAWEEVWTDRGRGTKDSYWLIFELLWRDYFSFLSMKYGPALFHVDGFNSVTRPQHEGPDWKYAGEDEEGRPLLDKWRDGKTGVPFIDANMIELKETGFMSNRGRQNVGCYLTKDYLVDWRAGAEVFEEELIDYDTSSNWGNWQYVAGVGTDPREARYFNPIKQAKDYDPQGDYVKLWIPSLKNVPTEHVHHPWTLPSSHPAFAEVANLYKTPPKEERGSWRSQYQRKVGENEKTSGNKAERVNRGPKGGRGGHSVRGTGGRGGARKGNN